MLDIKTIKAVTLDLDDTLWPVWPAIERAEKALENWLDWKDDPACRLVSHAVLEGLYEDGVSDAVVASIVPPDKKGEEKMRRSFVLGCPLCRPAFEAFCAYQARPKFSDGSKAAAFGKGFAPDLEKALLIEINPGGSGYFASES